LAALKRTADAEATDAPEPARRRLDMEVVATVKPVQKKEFCRLFGLWLIMTQTPFLRVDHPMLQKAMRVLGLELPGEKAFRTTMLDDLYNQTKATVEKETQQLLQGVGLMFCSDGWRKKAAGQGAQLVNFMILKPTGGMLFHSVFNSDNERKTGVNIKNLHLALAKEVRISS
jgi:hypothetical protein